MKDYEHAFKEASEKLPTERLIRCSCDCALINIDLIKPHTENFELIKSVLNKPQIAEYHADDSDDEAYYAADAAYYAAELAYNSRIAFSAVSVDALADAAKWAAKVSEESKQKVEQLINDMMKEAKEC